MSFFKSLSFKQTLCGASLIAITALCATTNGFAGALNANNALKAEVKPAANAIVDPAVQAEQALAGQLAGQDDLQQQPATAPDTAKTAPAAIPPKAATTTQMGPIIADPAQAEAQTPAAPAANTVAPPTLSDGTTPPPIDMAQDLTVPPLTPSTPGMDLPIEPEKTPEELEAEMREQAFKAAQSGLMPLRPDEIRRIKEIVDENKLAIETPVLPSPKPESTFTTISLDPGQAPVEIKTAMGNVTTLSLLDSTGQPWPIQDISWAGNFEVQQPEQGSNILRITPMSEFAVGNVSMRMIGLTPPVIMTLKTDRRSVQVRVDLQIPGNGPNAVVAPIQSQPSITTAAGDIGMTQILEGVPPGDAKKMKLSGVDGRTSAFDVAGITYVRTPYTLLSPAWNASLRSADGTNVYALRYAPVLLLSDKGQLRKVRLQKVEQDDE